MRQFLPADMSKGNRPGKVLVLFAFLLPMLLGTTGLVIDTGLMLAAQRQAQNAADAAALAAALQLFQGDTQANAQSTATTFVQQYNGLSKATVAVNFGSAISRGAYKGTSSPNFLEVIVTSTAQTWFIRALGIAQSTVQARAVAGFEVVGHGEGAIALDPRPAPGLSVSGGATLKVDGSLVVNSRGGGQDQYGARVNWGDSKSPSSPALKMDGKGTILARYVQVHGGVNDPTNIQNFDANGPNPLFCHAPIVPDPLSNLPVPTTSNVSSITNWTRKAVVSVTQNQSMTLTPGVYEDIQINNGSVTFNPGVYILSPQKPGQGLGINGSSTVTGNGVLFYVTGSNYLDTSPGYWDRLDGAVELNTATDSLPPPPDRGQVKFASVNINATNANVTLKGLQDSTSPFNGLLFFQRRRNTSAFSIQGNAGPNVTLSGTLYAKWANFKLAGGGRYGAQFLVGSMSVSGHATVTLSMPSRNFGRANQVFLVE